MAIITPQLIRSLFIGYNALFQQGLGLPEAKYQRIASVISSNTQSNAYGWLGQWPGFREWIGERVIKDMQAHGYQILNRDFESTIGIKRTDIEDDNVGIYAPLLQEMGRATAVFPDELVFGLLGQGFDNLCYDGFSFFSTEHPVNSTHSGSGQRIATSNTLIEEHYTGPAWYLLDTSRAIKPLIYQTRKAPQFVAMNQEEDESVFMRGEYRYGVDLRCNVGYGFWQMAFGVRAPLTLDNLWHAYCAMRQFRAHGGRPLSINPRTLVIPTSLEKQATQLLQRELFRDGDDVVSNELKGRFELVVADFL